ncbi:H-type small acid-soluble spore protein [Ornithinibacillus californiensis]|uniref:H-type small acid-soluble spore protein n=1 Tax=Ornithinibacillus californiensis TaxID=161536 RepID=UPI00064D7663|nr:H-type small acid-soluble spore protein [Ornithinibacillus californiensis]
MDLQQAEKIINADVFINVHYRGIPVYIQEVNGQTAKVFPLDGINHEQVVDLEGLNETGPISL